MHECTSPSCLLCKVAYVIIIYSRPLDDFAGAVLSNWWKRLWLGDSRNIRVWENASVWWSIYMASSEAGESKIPCTRFCYSLSAYLLGVSHCTIPLISSISHRHFLPLFSLHNSRPVFSYSLELSCTVTTTKMLSQSSNGGWMLFKECGVASVDAHFAG